MKESEEIPIAIPIIIFSVSCLFAGGIVAKYHYDLNPNFRSWVDERFLGAPNIMEIRAKEAIVEREAAVNRDSWAHRPQTFFAPTYSLEGNWQIEAAIRYRREDKSTFTCDYKLRLIVQKEPVNSGVVVNYNEATLRIVGLTKNGNKFTVQSETVIFVGGVTLQGEIINKDTMRGVCRFVFTDHTDQPVATNFTGHRVESFDLRS